MLYSNICVSLKCFDLGFGCCLFGVFGFLLVWLVGLLFCFGFLGGVFLFLFVLFWEFFGGRAFVSVLLRKAY